MFRIFRSIIPLMLGLAVFSTIAVADDTGLYVADGARIDADGISPVSGTRVDDSDFGFAYQGILGISYELSEQWSATADYRYFSAPDLSFGAGNGTGEIPEVHRRPFFCSESLGPLTRPGFRHLQKSPACGPRGPPDPRAGPRSGGAVPIFCPTGWPRR